MSTTQFALFREFKGFIEDNDRLRDEPDSLSEYLLAWVEHGNAVLEAGGDFGVYMQGVTYIIARWLQDPSILDFKGLPGKPARERRTTLLTQLQAVPNDSGYPDLAFDPRHFRTILLYRLTSVNYFNNKVLFEPDSWV